MHSLNSPSPSGQLVIVGAGGFGREALDVFEAMRGAGIRSDQFIGFVDDASPETLAANLAARNAPHLGPVAAILSLDADFVVAIGAPGIRHRLADMAERGGK